MSDWDDDDFGGFESADVGASQGVGDGGCDHENNIPSDSSVTVGGDSNPQSDILDWILSSTAKSDTSSVTESSAPQTPSATQNVNEAKNDEAPTPSSENLQQSETDMAEPSVLPPVELPPMDWSKDLSDAKKKIESLTIEDSAVLQANNETKHKLQAELDAALIMKEQSEKSLEGMKKELDELAVTKKKELEEKDRQQQKEISQLKRQHKFELDELQNFSEKTIQQLMNQYSEIWKTIEKEKSLECESAATSIVEKCLELMNQQHAVLSRKLEESRQIQETELKESLKNEEESINETVQKRLEEGKANIENEMNKALMENMKEQAEKLQELHSQTLTEAMNKQQAHFEESLQSMLTREREKFTERLKEAVGEAQLIAEKEMERKRKAERSRTKAHNLSVKMLLTSALAQVEKQFSDETEEENAEGT